MKLSIIIPCYNSARFIAKTLDMLISQGLSDCEVIVVNDGSEDETSKIVKKYTEKYAEIRLIDKQNEGVSVARNVGMQVALGEYIYFFDSDDTLAEGTLDFYRKTLVENPQNEFLAFGYYTQYKNRLQKDFSAKRFDEKTLNPLLLKQSFFSKKLCFNICSCIYKKPLLEENNIRFTQGIRIGEDVEFLLKVLQFAPDCLYKARHCFIYQIRDDSVMQGYGNYKHEWFESLKRMITQVEHIDWGKMVLGYKNFYIAYAFVKDIYQYWRSGKFDMSITYWFYENQCYLRRPMNGKIIYVLLFKILGYIPLRLLLK